MTDVAQRLRDVETLVAKALVEIADGIEYRCMTMKAPELRTIAARLAEPRGEVPAAGNLNPANLSREARRILNEAPDQPSAPHALQSTITAIIADDLHLPHSERHRIGPAVQRIMEAIAANSPCEPATVEQIAGIVQRWQEKPLTTAEISGGAAREIAALSAAPGVPAEIVQALEQAHDCISGETPEDCTHEEACEATLDRIRDALATCSLPTPAPDPAAAEIAKRLPSAQGMNMHVALDTPLFMYEARQALADAAAYIRRQAGEQGVC